MASKSFKDVKSGDIEKLKLADALEYNKQAIKFLEDTKDFTTKDVYTAIEFMNKARKIDRTKVTKGAQENGLAKQFVRIVQSLEGMFTSDKDKQGSKNLQLFLMNFGNTVTYCPELGIDFAKNGGVDYVISLIKRMEKAEDKEKKIYREYLNDLLRCLYNSVRHDECSVIRPIYRKAGAVSVLKELLASSEKITALLTLAFIVNEGESEILGKDNESVKYLVELFKEATLSKDHVAKVDQGNFVTKNGLKQLANGLNQLIVNDANKKVVFKCGGAKIMNSMLADGFSTGEQTIAAKMLWSLSFDESIRKSEVIKESAKALTRLTKSKDKSLASACKNALWQINGSDDSSGEDEKKSEAAGSKTRKLTPTQTHPYGIRLLTASAMPSKSKSSSSDSSKCSKKESGHIMISYNWTHQQLALKIRDELEAAGYTVWIDVDKMEDDILDSMADAVAKSSLVLLCMTQQYHESQNCRSEATYAYKKQKPVIPLMLEADYQPEGWLDILIGTKMYYKLCSDQEVKKNIDELKKAIDRQFQQLGIKADESVKPKKSETTSSAKTSEALSWSNKQVLKWFDEIKLPQLKEALDFCDGSDLKDIYEKSCRDTDTFEKEWKANFGLEYKDSLRFKSALKKIF